MKKKVQTQLAQGIGQYKSDDKNPSSDQGMSPPLLPATSFFHAEDPKDSRWLYARFDTPAIQQTEAYLCELEQAEACLLFSSGMAAMASFFLAFDPGSTILVQEQTYFVTREWLETYGQRIQLNFVLVDIYDEDKLQEALKEHSPKALWIETPFNPLWGIVDIQKTADICKQHNCLLAVDSTAATPVITQPLTLGADYVIHSASKVLNGHSDVIAGCIVTKHQDEFWQKVYLNRRLQGSILGAFESWLLLRGLRTLYVRVKQSSESALQIAEWLQTQPNVKQVFYPGFSEDIEAKQQMRFFGGMIAFTLDCSAENAKQVLQHCQLFNKATSYGELDSRIELRHDIQKDVPETLVRLSIGLEDTEDLMSDLAGALSILENLTKISA